ncbi:19425_t:CDS:2, partial [Gigaspora margarita]
LAKEVIEVANKQEKQKLPDWVYSNFKSHVYKLDNNNISALLKKEEYIVKKFFKYLSKELQDFSLSSKNMVIETKNPITSEMIFVKIYDTIVQAKKILEEKIYEVSYADMDIEGFERDNIKQIRKISSLAFERFNDKVIKAIQKEIEQLFLI